MRFNSSRRCLRICASRAESGSSSSSSRGSNTKARASATRCFCPPDSLRRAGVSTWYEFHQGQRRIHLSGDVGLGPAACARARRRGSDARSYSGIARNAGTSSQCRAASAAGGSRPGRRSTACHGPAVPVPQSPATTSFYRNRMGPEGCRSLLQLLPDRYRRRRRPRRSFWRSLHGDETHALRRRTDSAMAVASHMLAKYTVMITAVTWPTFCRCPNR